MARPTIVFTLGDKRAVRYWFHVPRLGEWVHVDGLFGSVDSVIWTDDAIKITLHE